MNLRSTHVVCLGGLLAWNHKDSNLVELHFVEKKQRVLAARSRNGA